MVGEDRTRETAAQGARRGAWRLASSSSAYLREASRQAIEWHPWGPEPFNLARKTMRPVLLDVGAVWCHWCHVMDDGTYSDAEVVHLVNENFIAIKVDRDENPEVDRKYQREVSTLTGEGGWPLTAFLFPEGETFLGGTYFPAEGRGGRPGFRHVLKHVLRLWREEPEALRSNREAIQEALQRLRRGGGHTPLTVSQLVPTVVESLAESFDEENGGWGSAPKFPNPVALSLLLFAAWKGREKEDLARAHLTLKKIAGGGIFDQLGGGFHRYSVDAGWHIPHFEKMTGENAYLLRSYVEGASAIDDPRLLDIVRGTTEYALLTLFTGDGFAASVDADNVPGDDGSYYTWSKSQLKEILTPEETRVIQWYYGIGAEGQMPHDPEQNVLYLFLSPKEISQQLGIPVETVERDLAIARKKMIMARGERPKPYVDTALYASVNGAMIGALSLAGRYLGDPRPVAASRCAADHFLARAYSPDIGVGHCLDPEGGRGFGLLEDQVEFARGLLSLAEVTQEGRYLTAASKLVALCQKEFAVEGEEDLLGDVSPRLYRGTLPGAPTLSLEDLSHISPNATMILSLDRLALLTENPEYEERAQDLLTAMARRARGPGLFSAGAALASGIIETPALRVVVEGEGHAAEALWKAAVESYHPRCVLFRGEPGAPFALPEEALKNLEKKGGAPPRAIICRGSSCLPPITDPMALRLALH